MRSNLPAVDPVRRNSQVADLACCGGGSTRRAHGGGSGLASGLGNWLTGELMDFFCFFDQFNEVGISNVPTSVNRLTEVGKGNHLRYSTINRDLSLEVVGLVCLQK
jgi:hypothetical protein